MRVRFLLLLLLASALSSSAARADTTTASATGFCPGPQGVSFQVTINFTPTGPGAATVKFTLENTSGVYPVQNPSLGNPVLTGFFFNVPPGTGVVFTEGRILAGSTLVSNGGTINSIPVPAGCAVLGTDLVRTTWYALVAGQATGQYGIFTSGLTTAEGLKAGLVDPDVYVACVAQGAVFAPIFVAGRVQFTIQLTNLPASFTSAQTFLGLCSTVSGQQQPSSIAGKFQATGHNGADSCFIGRDCNSTSAHTSTWGTVKTFYR
ncbi:MAG TPA: hypothetical protein VI504_16925 [Candidatus Eisenbacteria bacterium]|jgi:hypothetical protein